MRIDCHVHLSALGPGKGKISPRLLNSWGFKFMRWHFDLPTADASSDAVLVERLAADLDATPQLDAAVVLAFDAVYTKEGQRDEGNTHLYLSNDYVAGVVATQRKMLFGASVHPYRTDAIAELERCIKGGAVLCKWLPLTQGIDPSDRRCFEFYDALAHYKLPLLSHTGGEKMLPQVNRHADPELLLPAIRRGVTVIAAHCGTRSAPGETDYLDRFCRLALQYPNFYGDCSALNLPMRSHAYKRILADLDLQKKIVHGSDWPVMPIPPLRLLGWEKCRELMADPNWIRRDIAIKTALGLGEEFFNQTATVLKLDMQPPG